MKNVLAAISGLALLIGAGVANAESVTAMPHGTMTGKTATGMTATEPEAADVNILTQTATPTDKAPVMTAPGKMVGYIVSKDDASDEITLDNGYVFKLGSDPGAFHLNVGDRISVSWNTFTDGVLAAENVKVLHRAAS